MKRDVHLCGILSENSQPQSSHEKISDKLKNVLQNVWAKMMENQERLRGCLRLEEMKEERLHTKWHVTLDCETKDVSEKNGKSKERVEFS